MANETPAYEYSITLKGLWGRNRTPKFRSIKIARSETKIEDIKVAITKTLEICKREKVKPGCFVAIIEQPGIITDYGDPTGTGLGIKSFTFETLSHTTLASGWVSEDGTLNLS